jgi:hypothetical protein
MKKAGSGLPPPQPVTGLIDTGEIMTKMNQSEPCVGVTPEWRQRPEGLGSSRTSSTRTPREIGEKSRNDQFHCRYERLSLSREIHNGVTTDTAVKLGVFNPLSPSI